MGFAAVDQAAGVVANVVGFAAVTPAAFAAGVANVVGFVVVTNVGIVVARAAFAAAVVFPSPQNHSQLLFVTFTLERQK